MLQHISPRTAIWHHITPQSASHRHFQVHVPHHTATVHISHHPIYTTIPHQTHIHHHSIFHTTLSIFHIAFHHHIWHHNTLHHFHIWQRIAYATFFTTTILHHHTSHRYFPLMQHSTYIALCNIPHDTTFHTTSYCTFCISITPCLKRQHSHRTTFHIRWRHTTFHIKSLHGTTCRHTFHMPTFHAMHITFKYKFHITLSHSTTHQSHTAF